MAESYPTVRLNTGVDMPALGLGTWLSEPGKVREAVYHALKTGYKHIDCAAVYGNETEVGEGIAKWISEGGKREDIFITSKLWCTEHQPDRVKPALQKTLKDLNLEFLDLYIIHFPFALKPEAKFPVKEEDMVGYHETRMADTWAAMEAVAQEGLTKAIGVSNFTDKKLTNLLKTAKITPAVNQIELHPHLQQPELVEFCKKHDIQLTAYSPLGNPGFREQNGQPAGPMEDPVVKEVAEKHGVTPAQVCIRFAIERGFVVIPKSVTPSRINDNFQVLSFKLTEEDMAKLRSIKTRYRVVKFNFFAKEGEDCQELWDGSA